ncbi:MAG: MFS transporter [Zetaproteobacteria bacterium]|nr:MFS transporter [Pseudobdellovibrionaceae bacterium]
MKNKKGIIAWAFYDFANSAFTTLVVTFIYATYFTKSIAVNEISGTVLWSRAVGLSMFLVAMLSPFLGALVDSWGNRKQLLLVVSLISIVSTALLYFPRTGQVLFSLSLFVVANVTFELACVFYNAYLPELSNEKNIGRISGYAWSLGYVGGLLAMFLAMVGFVNPEVPWFGLEKENGENIRATNILVSVWFLFFSLPFFFFVKERKVHTHIGTFDILKNSFSQILQTFKEIKKHKNIGIFLLARLLYNDGLVTIFSFGAIYAAGTFDFSFEEIMIFGVVLNITAGLGAFIMGFFDDKWGGKKTIQLSLFCLIGASLIAVFAQSKSGFWFAGILVGLSIGPNQSASRSLMGRLVPKEKVNEFFGFFAFSGKLTAFLGPLFLGLITEYFSSQRAGVSSLLVFFVLGLFVLRYVDDTKKIT